MTMESEITKMLRLLDEVRSTLESMRGIPPEDIPIKDHDGIGLSQILGSNKVSEEIRYRNFSSRRLGTAHKMDKSIPLM